MKEYLVIYEEADDGSWGAHSSDIEGVIAVGVSRAEVERRMAEALAATSRTSESVVTRFRSRTRTPAAFSSRYV